MKRTVKKFTDEEDKFILANVGKMTCTEMANHLGRKPASVVSRTITLGLREPNRIVTRFEESEDLFIVGNAGKLSLQQIARELGRSSGSIWDRGRKLGVFFDRKKRTAKKTLNPNGYVRIPVDENNERRWTLEHIHIVEQIIRRRLVAGEQVHHINLIKDDNRPENLHLFKSTAAHNQAHASLSRLVADLLERDVIRFNPEIGEYELRN